MTEKQISDKPERRHYFVAILPDDPVKQKVSAIKEYFAERYHSKAALRSPPHITLFPPFYFDSAAEDKLVVEMEKFCAGAYPLSVELQNFKSFSPRIIYINVLPDAAIVNLYQALNTHFEEKLGLRATQRKERKFSPHVTVAFRDLTKENFYQAWKEYKDKPFSERFTAQAIAILKHNGHSWDVWHLAKLRSSPTGAGKVSGLFLLL